MTDDARRVLTEEGRAWIMAARREGGTCAACGRALTGEETVWVERIDVVSGRSVSHYRASLGRECASPAFLSETEGKEPERCADCGRGVYYRTTDRRRHSARCSKRCSVRYQKARARKEPRL